MSSELAARSCCCHTRTCTSSMNITDACPPALLGPEPPSQSIWYHAMPSPSEHTEKHKVVGKIWYCKSVIGFGATLRLPIVFKYEASNTNDLQTWG